MTSKMDFLVLKKMDHLEEISQSNYDLIQSISGGIKKMQESPRTSTHMSQSKKKKK